jgi:hypothetical protein
MAPSSPNCLHCTVERKEVVAKRVCSTSSRVFFQKELGSQHIPFFSVLSHHRECDTPGSCLLLSAITANPKIFKGSSVGLPSKALSRNNMRPFASTVAHRPSSALPFPTAASDTLDVRGWSVPLQKRQSLGMLLCDTNPQAPPGMPAAL